MKILKTHYNSQVTALVEFKPRFYDLLLIDVGMPLLDGFQLAQAFNLPKYNLAFSSIFASFAYCLIPSISLHYNRLITALSLYLFNMTEDEMRFRNDSTYLGMKQRINFDH